MHGRWEEAEQAVRDGNRDGLLVLIEAAPSLVAARGGQDVTLLHVAAECDEAELTQLLLDHGAVLEAEARWGQTAFEWAANLNAAAAANVLRERGALRQTLWSASALGRLGEFEALFVAGSLPAGAGRVVSPGADVTRWPDDTAFMRGDVLSDALYIAARHGHEEIVRRLLDRGADAGALGYFGAAALHWAALGGHDEVVTLLVTAGADRHLRDPEFGATPAGWAKEGGHEELADRLDAKE